jgi:hypothetical protein
MSAKKGKKSKGAEPAAGYAVGYGKPPKAHQFKKGHSGNPAGRPKGSVSLNDRFLSECERMIKTRTGDKVVEMTKIEVVIRRLLDAAMQGKTEAARLVLAHFGQASVARSEAEGEAPVFSEALLQTYKLLLDSGALKK